MNKVYFVIGWVLGVWIGSIDRFFMAVSDGVHAGEQYMLKEKE